MQNHSKRGIRSFIDIQTPAVPHLKVYPPHTHLMAIFPGLPRWAGTRKVKPIWILLNQETVSGSGISWAMCKSASRSREYHASTPPLKFFTGRMPFLLPNQQHQSTEVYP